MKKLLVSAAILIVGFIIDGSRSLVFAQQVGIKLFDATPVFGTGPQTSPAEAIPFASTSLSLDFAAGDTAVISSTADGTGPIVIDNFITINGVNACEGAPDHVSCFGQIINPDLPTGVPIESVLTPIPPIDVRKFIPVRTTAVLFELRDFGIIAGNTELFLVTTATVSQAPSEARFFNLLGSSEFIGLKLSHPLIFIRHRTLLRRCDVRAVFRRSVASGGVTVLRAYWG